MVARKYESFVVCEIWLQYIVCMSEAYTVGGGGGNWKLQGNRSTKSNQSLTLSLSHTHTK